MDTSGYKSTPREGLGCPLAPPPRSSLPFPAVTPHLPSQPLYLGALDGLLLRARCFFIQVKLQGNPAILNFLTVLRDAFLFPAAFSPNWCLKCLFWESTGHKAHKQLSAAAGKVIKMGITPFAHSSLLPPSMGCKDLRGGRKDTCIPGKVEACEMNHRIV